MNGKPKAKGKSVTISAFVSPELAEKLKAKAKREDRSLSYVVTKALRKSLA